MSEAVREPMAHVINLMAAIVQDREFHECERGHNLRCGEGSFFAGATCARLRSGFGYGVALLSAHRVGFSSLRSWPVRSSR